MEALEALGQVTDICSDKTGTLTQAKMVASEIWLATNDGFTITGAGIIPEGKILDQHQKEVDTTQLATGLKELMICSALCNSANVIWTEKTPYALDSEGRGVKAIGEPTEVLFCSLICRNPFIIQVQS